MKRWILGFVVLVLTSGVASADVFNMPSGQKSLEFVTVGDPGNAADTTGYGAVGYTYLMGKYDVTAAQYCDFLNAVAKTDTYGLYHSGMAIVGGGWEGCGCGIIRSGLSGSFSYSMLSGFENFPVNNVTWGDAARFCNWLQNGQTTGVEGAGTTETGAYALNGMTSNADLMTINRNAGATYFLPSQNEWYKAAFYKSGSINAGYWLYPTQSNDVPSNVLSLTGTNNANFCYGTFPDGCTDPQKGLTTVGAFTASPGPYGTYDQGGNVYQWNEAIISPNYRGLRGGAFAYPSTPIVSTNPDLGFYPTYVTNLYGFRIASLFPSNYWKGPGGGSYNQASNWSEGIVPNGVDATANFIGKITVFSQITLDSDVTLGTINFNSSLRYILKGTSSLNLQTSSGQSSINVQTGIHNINAPVLLNSDTLISGAGTLILTSGISGEHTLTLLSHVTSSSIQVKTLNVQALLTASTIQANSLNIGNTGASQAVPEPSTLALLGISIISLYAYVWRRRRA
jgi:formylglycine-generating enzyme